MRIAVLDIGGTSIKSGIWDGETLSELMERDTNAWEGGARLMERAAEILEDVFLVNSRLGLFSAPSHLWVGTLYPEVTG